MTSGQVLHIDDLDLIIELPDSSDTPWWIVGKDQNVYWKRCNVIIVEKDSEEKNKETPLKQCNGQGTVPPDIELYMSGQGGRVKER
ncbi:hypothetical protein PAAG_04219 [Paracoccidioides lutzii Pb01]|uniref:Uncharacterized protein n=1 Tax=Paracoccidioides lutzii (strain ATCC MYA-826 / Pb01) TaxID=502779 RepID=C1H0C5_PARBA|nr:hypothetical protein PAAG_04219 [Paracoccidioides lutzii Pb01]EEH33166.2 hypothetical protein PAAG_04219 [Paracoccidioides lutzii Pb01]